MGCSKTPTQLDMSAKTKSKTITLTIPAKLLQRFNNASKFEAEVVYSCTIGELASLKERLLLQLAAYCEMIEDDIILDADGNHAGSHFANDCARFKAARETRELAAA